MIKRLLALVAGAFGVRAAIELVRRRRRGDDSLADDLRARLNEARGAAPEPVVDTSPAAEPSEAGAPDVDALRADVHERARRAIDELNG